MPTEIEIDNQVATEADRVADVFYVRDRDTGTKITDAPRLANVGRALRAALGSLSS